MKYIVCMICACLLLQAGAGAVAAQDNATKPVILYYSWKGHAEMVAAARAWMALDARSRSASPIIPHLCRKFDLSEAQALAVCADPRVTALDGLASYQPDGGSWDNATWGV